MIPTCLFAIWGDHSCLKGVILVSSIYICHRGWTRIFFQGPLSMSFQFFQVWISNFFKFKWRSKILPRASRANFTLCTQTNQYFIIFPISLMTFILLNSPKQGYVSAHTHCTILNNTKGITRIIQINPFWPRQQKFKV